MAARAKKSKEFVRWATELLALGPEEHPIKSFDELKTGVHFLQIIHSIAPMSFDLARCDFVASTEYHYEKNWKVAQEIMAKNEIYRDFVIERVSQGEKQKDLFYLVAYLEFHYDTLKAQRLPSAKDLKDAKLSPEKRTDLELAMLPYDAYAERKRAVEKRKKITRVPGQHKLGRFSFDTKSISDSSQISAFSSYSTRGMLKKVRFKSNISDWVQGTEQPSLICSARRGSTPRTPGGSCVFSSPRSDTPTAGGGQGSGGGTPTMKRDTSPINQLLPSSSSHIAGIMSNSDAVGVGGAAAGGTGSNNDSEANSAAGSPSSHSAFLQRRNSFGGGSSNGGGGDNGGRATSSAGGSTTATYQDPTANAARLMVGAALKNDTSRGEAAEGRSSREQLGVGTGGDTAPPSVNTQLDFSSSGAGGGGARLTLMPCGPSNNSLFGAGMPLSSTSTLNTAGTANHPPNSALSGGGLSEDHFLREVILMDAVEVPSLGAHSGRHFWSFDAWPKTPAGSPGVILDVAGDRVHKLFSYEEVKRSAKIRQEQQAVVATAKEAAVHMVKESSVAWELEKEGGGGAVPEVVADPAAKHLSLGATNNNWGDFDAMMEEEMNN